MGIFDKVKKTTIESRRYEEKLYEVALEEVEAGERRKGLYSKALAKADGDTEKADGIYLKLRVQSIMDDIESEQIDRRINEKAYKELQELREIEIIDNEPTIENAKKKAKDSNYRVGKLFLEKIYFVDDKYSKKSLYQTTDLIDLHNWLDVNLTKQ
jgi:hypothetical protein